VELLGEGHPSSMVARGNLGQIYEMMGLFDQAEPLLKETLALMESILGESHADTLSVRNNLALLYESQGNFREAEPLYEKSRALMIELFGEDHNNPTAVANNLAYLYMLMEEYEKSSAMFEEVILRWEGIFGPEHQNTLKARNNLGRVYKRQGVLDLAEQNIAGALTLRQSVLGEDHIDAIRSMIDLGGVYIDQGRNEEAVAMLTEALALSESRLGNLHPYTFDALNYLAAVNENMNELQSAIEIRERGFVRRSEFLDTMLWTTGENAREGYIRLYRPEFNDYLGLLARVGDSAAAQKLIDASLQRKGLLLKVTSEIQQIATMTTDPQLAALANELEQARVDLASMTLSGPTAETGDNHVEVLYQLEQRVNEIQGELGRASVRFRTSIAGSGSDRLTLEMAEDSALVDFMMYESDGEPAMLAGVVTKFGNEVEYHIVKYDDRAGMEEAISYYREMIQDDLVDEDELAEIGIETYIAVWDPLMEVLDDLDYVYLIPDGLLNIVPFGALMNEDEEYLIQTHDLHLLTSGRDLLPNEYQLAVGEYLVMAGPDYDSADVVADDVIKAAEGRRSAALQMGIRGAGGGLRGLNFAPLPGAEEEGKIIIEQVVSNDGSSDNFFGNDAQEQILFDMNSAPEILHVATHGFFLKPDEGLRKRLLKAMRGTENHVPPPGDNPMLRAGLAFAGINTNAQFLGDIETTNDGVLTALEVLDLNLSGTKLVVLSACETGLGEIHEGEGVYGLRRSFQEAGVAEVISSLWEVSDAGTQALMTDFYDRMLNGMPAREAMRETQLEMIEDPQWGYPYIWSAFMIVGSYESAGFAVN
jgi:CHAT domain-containing protein/Flp pilus assembly protein TadD